MHRSTPVEVLHTLLLGVCKYMLRAFMEKRTAAEKREIIARIYAFPYSGFSNKITGNICRYYKSLVGRDYKCFMQMCLFIILPYLSNTEKQCWLLLSKVMALY